MKQELLEEPTDKDFLLIANEIHIEANGEIWVESEGSSVMERSYFDDESDYYNEEDYEA